MSTGKGADWVDRKPQMKGKQLQISFQVQQHCENDAVLSRQRQMLL